MGKTALLALGLYLLLKPKDAAAGSASTNVPTTPPPVDNTRRDIDNAFDITRRSLDLMTELLNRKSGSTVAGG